MPFGTGANGLSSASSRVHADAACGSVPPAGPQRSVQWEEGSPPEAETVIESAVRAAAAACIEPNGTGLWSRPPVRLSNAPTSLRCLVFARTARKERADATTRVVAVLEGKRIFVTGGAGFAPPPLPGPHAHPEQGG